ncbi:hypothetical protein GCM10009077_41960 [Roseibium denhamense]
MTGQGNFQSTAKRRAVKDAEDRCLTLLQEIAKVRKPWVLGRLSELTNICAGNKCAAVAVQADYPDGLVSSEELNCLPKSAAHGM